jgi:hypothetical protein
MKLWIWLVSIIFLIILSPSDLIWKDISTFEMVAFQSRISVGMMSFSHMQINYSFSAEF